MKGRQIALGGVVSGLCAAFMLLTGILPFGSLALPMAAGAMVLIIVVELGCKAALAVYASVGLLSLLLSPDKGAAVLFLAFFGYYPVAKQKLEKLPGRLPEYLCKLALYSAALSAGYLAAIHLFGMAYLFEGLGDLARYAFLLSLGAGVLLFTLYDFALTRCYGLYVGWLRHIVARK